MLFLLFALIAIVAAHAPLSLNRFAHVRRQASVASAFSDASSVSSSTSRLAIGSTALSTNGSHLLVSLPLTSGGYSAIGRGSSMASNTWMVVAYIPDGETTPTLEVRKSSGHRTPALLTNGAPDVSLVSSDATTAVFWVVDSSKAFSTNGAEAFIFASSSTAPSGGSISIHDSRKFGAFNARFTPTSTTNTTSSNGNGSNSTSTSGNTSSSTVDIPWTKYDSIIIVHAIVAATAWMLIAPAAVLLARLGRNIEGWVRIHQLFQSVLTTLLTVIAVILAVVAIKTNGGGGPISGHKLMGFVLLVLLITQVGLGFYIHEKFDPNRTKRPPRNIAHIFLGITLLVLGYIQVYTGLKTYDDKRPGYFPSYIYALFGILAISPFIFYFISVGILIVHRRRKDGMSWSMAMFGLGREGGSLPTLKKMEETPVGFADTIQPYPAEKGSQSGNVSGRTSPADSEKAKASVFNFGRKQSKENLLPKASRDLQRNASWGNANVEKFNRTNGLGSASSLAIFPPNQDFGVLTYGAGIPQGRQQQERMMPGYEEPSKPMPLRAATLNYKQPAQYEYQQNAMRQQQQQQRSASPPSTRPRPSGPQAMMPQRSLTNDQYYQQDYYRSMQQPQQQQRQQQRKNYLDLGE